eukprot:Opistho-2@66955
MLLVLNMTDMARKEGIHINVNKLAERLGIQVVAMSARKNDGLDVLKKAIAHTTYIPTQVTGIDVSIFAPEAIAAVKAKLKTTNDYFALQVLHQHEHLEFFTQEDQLEIEAIEKQYEFETAKIQGAETVARYRYLSTVLTDLIFDTGAEKKFKVTDKLDSILTNRFWGFFIFLAILFFVFNAIFSWSAYPMELIETSFVSHV